MAIGSGNIILASDYNTIQTAVATILGTGSGDKGYGQAVSSSQVTTGSNVSASHMQNLKSDLDKISFHQSNVGSGVPSISVGGTINASDWSSYSTSASTLDGTRFNIATEQATLTTGVNPSFSTWVGTRTHVVSVTFGSSEEARFFFNAGGEIRVIPTHSGHVSSTTKGGRWNNLFSSVIGASGVRFRASTTIASGGTGSSYGWNNLTGTQTIYTAVDTGTYSGNDLTITASKTATVLTLNIYYNDDGSTGNVDESVDGTTVSTVSHFRATGSYVSVTGPTIATVSGP